MGLFECIRIYDFINTLGVVYVPYLRKPTGGDARRGGQRAPRARGKFQARISADAVRDAFYFFAFQPDRAFTA